MAYNRRSFLATLGAAALGTASVIRPAAASNRRAPNPLGLQLYTVRDAMRTDLPGTLERVSRIGYTEVEFAGYFGHSPAGIRQLLDRFGLAGPSAHVALGAAADWERSTAAAVAAGHTFITVPWVPESARGGPAAWRRLAEQLNTAATVAKAVGLRLAYHNHDFELRPAGDVVPLEVLIAGTDPDLVSFQLDVYWLTRAGHDPVEWLDRYPGRFSMLHLKDSSGPPAHRMLDVGRGVIDFAAILARGRAAGIRHSFVEHDDPADAFASIRSSHDYLARLPTNEE